MNREQLLQAISFLFQVGNPISLRLYFLVSTDNGMELKLANIEQEVTTSLLTQFKGYIQSKFIDNEELFFGNLTDADNRRNSAYNYDFDEKPEGLSYLDTVLKNEEQAHFNFNVDDLNNIKAFVILIGNEEHKISLYKKHYPINYLRRDSILRIFPSNERFEKVNTNILSISETFEFMQIGQNLIVLSVKVLEKYFGYDTIIRNKAIENLTLIQNSGLLVDIQLLNTLTNELKYAKRIVKIKHDTPVLQLPVNTVIFFIANHPVLSRKIRFNADSTQIALDTKVSQEHFIKLLNDDFLKSELTNLFYDSQSKDTLRIEENADQEQVVAPE
ncbi:anti-phage protein KwaB [Pedobacter fastidiosus]|uniref:DUF4868 domain-containing protein n=1 Tax=Pedobacter fastidiosus TaxID=2765361 RepID=A0ABR7KU04_9SPHI|nr:anti-phage protein KwaB [Pedobacter fastidiosus]MBC6111526.1 DUF4868 domain-containing protein [Pedobacter fastidiosus]